MNKPPAPRSRARPRNRKAARARPAPSRKTGAQVTADARWSERLRRDFRGLSPLAQIGAIATVAATVIGLAGWLWPNPLADLPTVPRAAIAEEYKSLDNRQIDSLVASLEALRQEGVKHADKAPRVADALDQARKGNLHLAEGMLRQIYEDRAKERDTALKEQAEAARNLASVVYVNNAAKAAEWYRKAAELDPGNSYGWLMLAKAERRAGNFSAAVTAIEEGHKNLLARLEENPPASVFAEMAFTLEEMGSQRIAAGDLDGAFEAYAKAHELAQALNKSRPYPLIQTFAAEYQRQIGVIHERRGEPEKAMDAYRKSLATLQETALDGLSDLDRANVQVRVIDARTSIGDLLRREGKFAEARVELDAALALAEERARANGFWGNVATVHEAIAVLLYDQKKYEEALEAYRKALPLRQRFADEDKSDKTRLRLLRGTWNDIAGVYEAQEKFGEARAIYLEGERIFKELSDASPGDLGLRHDLSIILSNIGNTYYREKRTDEARAYYLRALEIKAKLAAADETNLSWHVDLAQLHWRLALADPGEAARHYEDARKTLAPFAAAGRLTRQQAEWMAHFERKIEQLRKAGSRG